MALCLSEAEFKAAMKHLQCNTDAAWIKNNHSHATAHYLESPRGLTCVVCMRGYEGCNPVEVAGLLVHEAVHVWQHWCDDIGETNPGAEQEAHGVQALAQELLAEYARRIEAR